MPERKYVLTKVGPGDYILPSNDARTIWRIVTYEDGPSHGLEDWPRDRTLWRTCRWAGRVDHIDLDDWESWESWEDGFARRRDAIDSALTARG